MPELGDVYQLTTKGTYLGQNNENVYFYRVQDVPTETAIEGLADEFADAVIPVIADLQSTTFNYHTIHIVNLFDASDVFELPIDIDGTVACGSESASAASFMAAHFRLVRDNARVRNGAKYFGGLCEGILSGNNIAGMDTVLSDIGDALIATLTAGVTDQFRPVLVKRVRTVAHRVNQFDETVSYYKYSLPESQAQMGNLWAYVRSAVGSTKVSHMDSRQEGRGD